MFWYGTDNLSREALLHSCHRGTRQISPKLSIVRDHGFYEDGYFRGLRRGKQSIWFKGSPHDYHVIKCKACREIAKLDDSGTIISVERRK